MKKTKLLVSVFFLLLLMLCLTVTAPAVSAEETPTVTFMTDVNGQLVQYETRSAVNGKVVMPAIPPLVSGFVGWTAEVGGQTVVLPEGASCDGITEDTVFHSVSLDFATDTGCSVRLLDDDVALRFTSSFSLDQYLTLTEMLGGKSKLSFGTYIVPADYVSGTFTLEALAAAGHDQYLDVPATGFYTVTDTTVTIAGSVGHILKNHYTLTYSGIGYMKVTYTNGAVKTIYATFNQQDNSRSIYKVVLAAYEDRDESYDNLIIEETGSTHSPYTNSELALCKRFLDDIVTIGHSHDAAGKYYYFTKTFKYYVSPWTVTSTLDNKEDATIVITAPDGRTVDEIKGIDLDGAYKSLNQVQITNGKMQFVRSSWIGAY